MPPSKILGATKRICLRPECNCEFTPKTKRHTYCCSKCCGREKTRRYRILLGPKWRAAQNREGNLQRNYGISTQDYEQMLASQNEMCAICSSKKGGNRFQNERLHVDNDHTTGQVRGLWI